jgi:crossover junction endodeoxyribonuclease RuvC
MAGRSEVMLIIGIDPSLTSTGIVVLRDGKVELAVTTKNKPALGTIDRVRLIYERIVCVAESLTDGEKWQAPDLIVIEGFSYGSKGRSVFDIAYLGWRIREELERLRTEDNIPWLEVPPSQLKKFATGQGNANKEIILQQVYKRWGVEFSDNNQADAYVLAQIGRAYLGDTEGLTAFQQEVITNLKGEKPKKKPRKKVEK